MFIHKTQCEEARFLLTVSSKSCLKLSNGPGSMTGGGATTIGGGTGRTGRSV